MRRRCPGAATAPGRADPVRCPAAVDPPEAVRHAPDAPAAAGRRATVPPLPIAMLARRSATRPVDARAMAPAPVARLLVPLLLLAACAAPRPEGPWGDVAAVWISPLRTDQVDQGPPPPGSLRPGSLAVDAHVLAWSLTRATPQDQPAKLRLGKLLLVERDDGRREFLRAEVWTAWVGTPDGRQGWVLERPDWEPWWFGVLEPTPDWEALETLEVFDRPGSPFSTPEAPGLVRDPRPFAAMMSRATRGEQGQSRPYTRLGLARFEDGGVRRLSLGEEGTVVVVEHGGTWLLDPADRQAFCDQVLPPPSDWSRAVAVRPWPLSPFVEALHPPADEPLTDADRQAAVTFRELAGRARFQRAMPPFGRGNLLVVTLDDGRRLKLAVSADGTRFRQVGRQGHWTLAEADRPAWRALAVRND